MEKLYCNEHNLDMAIKLCTAMHKNQLDKAGNPYSLHPLRVAAMSSKLSLDCVVVGLLHDVVEDHGDTITLHWLEKYNKFPHEIVEAIDAITRRADEPQESYLYRVSCNDIATTVKFNDIKDNSDPERLALLPSDLADRLTKKYAAATELLKKYTLDNIMDSI